MLVDLVRPCPECEVDDSAYITWELLGSETFKVPVGPPNNAEIQIMESDLYWTCGKCVSSGTITEARVLWKPCPAAGCDERSVERVHWRGMRVVHVNRPGSESKGQAKISTTARMHWDCDTCSGSGWDEITLPLPEGIQVSSPGG